jgi:hypothetical protein
VRQVRGSRGHSKQKPLLSSCYCWGLVRGGCTQLWNRSRAARR